MFKGFKVLGMAAVAAALMAVPASAATVIDFSTGNAGEGGSITWDGAHYIGAGIPIGAVRIVGAPDNNGTYAVTGLVLDLDPPEPNDNDEITNQNGWGSLDFNTNPGANFMSISGCIPGMEIGTFDANGNCTVPVLLAQGTIQGYVPGAPQGLLSAFGEDTKNQELLAFVGLDPNTPFEFFGFSLATYNLENGIPGTAISTDFRNSSLAITPVPEPATMMLLGTGLLAAFRARRKQQQQQL